jgi:hypothetical protein
VAPVTQFSSHVHARDSRSLRMINHVTRRRLSLPPLLDQRLLLPRLLSHQPDHRRPPAIFSAASLIAGSGEYRNSRITAGAAAPGTGSACTGIPFAAFAIDTSAAFGSSPADFRFAGLAGTAFTARHPGYAQMNLPPSRCSDLETDPS